MKKEYKNPTLEVIKIATQQMLAGSGGGVTTGSGVGNEVKGSEDYGRFTDSDWDDEY